MMMWLLQAVTLGWVDFRSFDLQQFEFFEAVENGDLTVVIPGKFVAFAGPSYNGWTPPPAYYAQHFKRMGVTTVIRTNNKLYDRTEFTRYGIKHYDLFFPDGTPPPEAQAKRFLSIVESEPGMVAVHCKAGLGRTGTLILMWAMKHFRWGANEAIGYLRWMRPGSIIGPQQQFLKANESRLWRMGQNAQAREAAMAAAAQPGQTMHSHTGTNGNGSSSSSGNGSGGNGSGGRVSSGPPDARQQAMAMEKHRPASSQQALGGGVSSMSVSASHLNGGQAQDRPTTFGGGGSGSRRSNGKSRSSSRGGVSGSGRRIRTGRSGLDGLGGSGHSKGAGGGGGGGPAGSNVVDEWRNQTSTLRFGRANGTASGSVSPGGEKPMHHRLTHSLNGYVKFRLQRCLSISLSFFCAACGRVLLLLLLFHLLPPLLT
jgi:cell division cycle 14